MTFWKKREWGSVSRNLGGTLGTRALRGHWRDGRVRSSTGPALIASQTFSQARTRSEEGLVGFAPPRSPALGNERHDTTGGRERPPFSFFGSLPGGPAELTKNLVSSVGFFCRKRIGNWIFEGGSRWGVREYEFTELWREREIEKKRWREISRWP